MSRGDQDVRRTPAGVPGPIRDLTRDGRGRASETPRAAHAVRLEHSAEVFGQWPYVAGVGRMEHPEDASARSFQPESQRTRNDDVLARSQERAIRQREE